MKSDWLEATGFDEKSITCPKKIIDDFKSLTLARSCYDFIDTILRDKLFYD